MGKIKFGFRQDPSVFSAKVVIEIIKQNIIISKMVVQDPLSIKVIFTLF